MNCTFGLVNTGTLSEETAHDSSVREILIITASKVRELLQSCALLMKGIEVAPQTFAEAKKDGINLCDKKHVFLDWKWDYLINPMKDPIKTRKEQRDKTDKENQDTITFAYTETGEIKEKFRENFYHGTRKTSASLLPADGKMAACFINRIGLLFDSTLCQIKNKYVFEIDAITDVPWWKIKISKTEWDTLSGSQKKEKLQFVEESIKKYRATADACNFQELQNRVKAKPPEKTLIYNEVLISMTRESLCGVFYPARLGLFGQLSAISKKIYMRKKLSIDIPLFQKGNGFTLISKEQQILLIEDCLANHVLFEEIVHELFSVYKTYYGVPDEQVREILREKLQEMKTELLLSFN